MAWSRFAVWVKQAEVDEGVRPGRHDEESERVRDLEQEVRELRRANEILRQSGDFLRGGARPPAAQIVAFIDANKDDVVDGRRLGVEPICRVLQVAPSSYYAARDRPPSARAQRDAELVPRLVELWKKNYEVYGVAEAVEGRPARRDRDRPRPDRPADAPSRDPGRAALKAGPDHAPRQRAPAGTPISSAASSPPQSPTSCG